MQKRNTKHQIYEDEVLIKQERIWGEVVITKEKKENFCNSGLSWYA